MEYEIQRYSVSQITQGEHRFYTLTMPSDVLAKCCFVSTRNEDPVKGFQRVLDKKRAEEIARYIDSGFGTIPSSIVLSAQSDAELKIVGRGKTLEFRMHPKAFLVLDGQHRVYGFSLAKSNLRVPVVIYNALSRRDESRLFIDINSKQRGVPNELLLDIKKLAEYETDVETSLRELFDSLNDSSDSALFGSLSPSSRAKNKISRVTFYSAIKPLFSLFEGRSSEEIFATINNYFRAFKAGLEENGVGDCMVNTTVFKAIAAFFPSAASKVKDRYGSDYTADNFYNVMEPMFSRLKPSKITKPGNSYKALVEYMESCLKTEFSL